MKIKITFLALSLIWLLPQSMWSASELPTRQQELIDDQSADNKQEPEGLKDQVAVPEAGTSPTIYLRNSSEYTVRIAVGPEYPTSIALYPKDMIEFPLKQVSTISASTYGKFAHHWSGLEAKLELKEFFKNHPEFESKNCIVDITYDKGSTGFWVLFSQGKWMLTLRTVDENKDLNDYHVQGTYSENLYSVVAHSSEVIPETIATGCCTHLV